MTAGASATSVVVSTYTEARWDDLAACLGSLARQALEPREVIVVVDHNPDLLERARRSFPWAQVIANERPRGLAGARNAGIAVARGEIVAFVDDDACAEPEWLRELESAFADAAAVGGGGALLPLWPGHEARWMPREFYWVIGCSYAGLPEQGGRIRNPIGANMAVRREVLEEVGGFREAGEAGAPRELRARGVVRAAGNVPDDTDLAIRVSELRPNGVWLYRPSARVWHRVSPERATFGYFIRRCYEEGVGKASLAQLVGAEAGLASERRHVAVALPKGAARELGNLLRGDAAAGLRIGALAIGLAATAGGYAWTRFQQRRRALS